MQTLLRLYREGFLNWRNPFALVFYLFLLSVGSGLHVGLYEEIPHVLWGVYVFIWVCFGLLFPFVVLGCIVAKTEDRELGKNGDEDVLAGRATLFECQRKAEENTDRYWAGKKRSCPKCNTEFTSVQDKGACPKCSHIFFASYPEMENNGASRESDDSRSSLVVVNDKNSISECYRKFKQACKELPNTGCFADRSLVYYPLVVEAVNTALRLPVSEQEDLVRSLRSCDLAFLRGISVSGATQAVITGDEKWIILGLKGLCLEQYENDYRETLMNCVLLQHSAGKIGSKLSELLAVIQEEFHLQIPSVMGAYFSNPVQDLESMGYSEGVDSEGDFKYIRNW